MAPTTMAPTTMAPIGPAAGGAAVTFRLADPDFRLAGVRLLAEVWTG
jgi:hypothetical protein